MKRACYYQNKEKKYEIRRVRSLGNDGNVRTEPIEMFKNVEFDNLTDLFMNANLSGYGVIGSMEEVESRNREKFNKKRNGLNIMNPDDL